MDLNRYIITKQLIRQNRSALVIEYPYGYFRKQFFPQKARIPYPSDDTAELYVLACAAGRYGHARNGSGRNVRCIARVPGRVRIQHVLYAAQFWGKGDKDNIEKLFGYSMRLLLPILALFFGCTMLMPEAVMRIYTNEPLLIANGIPYLRIASFSYIFMGLSIIYESILKNVGLVKQCTFASTVMVILNVFLNAVFIYGLFGIPKMGASGAALASAMASLTGFIFCVYFLCE